MSNNATGANESTEIEPRTERALSECLSVVALNGTPVDNRDETVVMVVSHTGESYHVDAELGWCECPDLRHRNVECKHIQRARVALGIEPVDSRVLAAIDVDPTLATNAPGPIVATSDSRIDHEGDWTPLRPSDCDCGGWNDGEDLPCWPCYRDGFEEPAGIKGEN
ncbi:hypothetical protein BRD17_04000 [Halobacteriales archaeon SW_7_68_16]|nr:MAG: hypothetical protein BRD17_04000 [Halobacteriales archaeon SW_7_68_16]